MKKNLRNSFVLFGLIIACLPGGKVNQPAAGELDVVKAIDTLEAQLDE